MKAKFIVFNFNMRDWLCLSIGKFIVHFLHIIILASPGESKVSVISFDLWNWFYLSTATVSLSIVAQ